jgi:hypothetical protein
MGVSLASDKRRHRRIGIFSDGSYIAGAASSQSHKCLVFLPVVMFTCEHEGSPVSTRGRVLQSYFWFLSLNFFRWWLIVV